MNRAERREMMKKNPKYREAIKVTAEEAMDKLWELMERKWGKDD